jgi:Exonuclease
MIDHLENLRIRRSLSFIDLEATGLNTNEDRIVELAVLRFEPDEDATEHVFLFNPTVPIPAAASRIHGIRDEHVEGRPTFAQCAPGLTRLLDDCDLAGFNLTRYHLPLLIAEFDRARVPFVLEGRAILDAARLFHRFHPRDLSAALQHYRGQRHSAPMRRSRIAAQLPLFSMPKCLPTDSRPSRPCCTGSWPRLMWPAASAETGRRWYSRSADMLAARSKRSRCEIPPIYAGCCARALCWPTLGA